MASGRLDGKTIAIVAGDGRVELTGPRDALRIAGATVHAVSPDDGGLPASTTPRRTTGVDLKNSSAKVSDQEVVVDGKLVTSRNPGDLGAFTAKTIAAVAAG